MNKAFTLIELLIVIAIIGILAGAITVTLSDETGTARNATIKLEASSAIPKLTIAYVNGESGKLCDKVAAKEGDNIEKVEVYNPSSWDKQEIKCLSLGWTWAIAGKLEVPEDDGEYWCADEGGFRGPSDGFANSTTEASCTDPS